MNISTAEKSSSRLFIDTGAWVALANSRDQYHSVVASLFQDLESRNFVFTTSYYILDETIVTLRARQIPHGDIVDLSKIFSPVKSFCMISTATCGCVHGRFSNNITINASLLLIAPRLSSCTKMLFKQSSLPIVISTRWGLFVGQYPNLADQNTFAELCHRANHHLSQAVLEFFIKNFLTRHDVLFILRKIFCINIQPSANKP